ncbi:MAG: 50S ribosomal protein L15 [Candidatus Lindowbacteria bacterium]|nr:50S ribosomal protein L15 [Candidatus Lindowbacteria bacterium]
MKDRAEILTITDLAPNRGAKRNRKRIGRGVGSGVGKTSGKGEKGQKARAGYSVPDAFEGGQMPLIRRTPKRGFNSPFRVEYKGINLCHLNQFEDGETIDPMSLFNKGLIDGRKRVKVLAKGTLEKKLTIKAHAFSKAAKAAIEAKGGTAEILP